jgi:hypothetical protein
MKVALRLFGAVVAVLVVLMVLQAVASERGEVAIITTTDVAGTPHETHVWIVDLDGHPWIRSGSAKSGWYARLKETPTLELERNGIHMQYTVEAVPDKQAQINALMRAKYGWADAYIGLFFSRANSVPIRLDPRSPET